MSFIEEQRRAQIVNAGVEVLANNGYAKASLMQIALEAGVSKGVVTYHFADKNDLLTEVLTQVMARWWGYIQPHLAAAEGAWAKLEAYLRYQVSYVVEHPKDLIAVGEITNNHRDSDGSHTFMREALGEELELLRGLLSEGQAEGAFRAFDLDLVSMAIEGAVEAVLHRWAQIYSQHESLSSELEQRLLPEIDELIEFVYRGIHK